jgi:hypothetical protein
VGLQLFDVWDYGSEYLQGYGCLSPVRFLFCHAEVSATGRSLVRKSPPECGVSEFD